jgi:hypothetical protein
MEKQVPEATTAQNRTPVREAGHPADFKPSAGSACNAHLQGVFPDEKLEYRRNIKYFIFLMEYFALFSEIN